jgi:hypothetical protein
LFAEEVRCIVGNIAYQNFLRGITRLSENRWKSRTTTDYNIPFFPHIRSLQKHYSGLSLQNSSTIFAEDQHVMEKYLNLMQSSCPSTQLILYNDNTDIVPGIVVHVASRRLFGLVDQLLPICKANETSSISFEEMVRKANVSLLGTSDNKLFFPVG